MPRKLSLISIMLSMIHPRSALARAHLLHLALAQPTTETGLVDVAGPCEVRGAPAFGAERVHVGVLASLDVRRGVVHIEHSRWVQCRVDGRRCARVSSVGTSAQAGARLYLDLRYDSMSIRKEKLMRPRTAY